MKKVVLITQARMGSTRLPGKIMTLSQGYPLLYWFLKRAQMSQTVSQFVVATTESDRDDPIHDVVVSDFPEIHITRGSENDVLSRYAQAAQETKADIIVRVTSDCPFLDWELIDRCVERFIETGCDALRTLRGDFPIGLDVEVFSRHALDRANQEARQEEEREHVGPYIYTNPGLFDIYWLHSEGLHWPPCRLTLDYPEDLTLVNILYEKVGPLAEAYRYSEYLQRHPEVAAINMKYLK